MNNCQCYLYLYLRVGIQTYSVNAQANVGRPLEVGRVPDR